MWQCCRAAAGRRSWNVYFQEITKTMSSIQLFETNNLRVESIELQRRKVSTSKLSHQSKFDSEIFFARRPTISCKGVFTATLWAGCQWICEMGAGLAPRVLVFAVSFAPLSLQSTIVSPHSTYTALFDSLSFFLSFFGLEDPSQLLD